MPEILANEFAARADELIAAGAYLHERGWVPATSGNFSARLAGGSLAVTVSGRHKGRLTRADILRADAEGRSFDGRAPSAETLLHVALYHRFPAVNAVLHPHSPGAILVSRLFGDALTLENHELLKALDGIRSHDTRITVPIFPNDQDIARLAGVVDTYLDRHPDSRAYILAGHGFYTWGASVGEALHHVEALEFLFDLEIRLHGVKKS